MPRAYIGEAEDCTVRFKQHNKSKDSWNVGVAIVSRTGSNANGWIEWKNGRGQTLDEVYWQGAEVNG